MIISINGPQFPMVPMVPHKPLILLDRHCSTDGSEGYQQAIDFIGPMVSGTVSPHTPPIPSGVFKTPMVLRRGIQRPDSRSLDREAKMPLSSEPEMLPRTAPMAAPPAPASPALRAGNLTDADAPVPIHPGRMSAIDPSQEIIA